jgi:maltokinase
VHSYDAVHDREAMAVYLRAFAQTPGDSSMPYGGLVFHRLSGHELDLESHSTLFSGEQSNSSVAFGDDSLLKVFRKVTPGRNPDIEIHRALTEAENPNVAALYGWIEAGEDDLGMIQQFLRTAADGWDLALGSVRNLMAEADLHADEVGGDFAGEAERLGAAVAEVHVVLREQFGTEAVDSTRISEGMSRRLTAAVAAVPQLAEHAPALEDVFVRIGNTKGEAQRVHGDLHLGQTLRTSLGWKLVDFEGEPARPLAERRLPDSPWRDVAGMLRSFDYAAQSVVKDLHSAGDPGPQVTYRAAEWIERNRTAFLDGYVDQRGTALTPEEWALVQAFEADKAVYEVVYEARNRPRWLDIPLGAIERIGAER